jgi:hypothetical protein
MGPTVDTVLCNWRVYARWYLLEQKYGIRDADSERWRPQAAITNLYEAAYQDAGLSFENVIWPVINKTAKQHKVPRVMANTVARVKFNTRGAKSLLKQAAEVTPAEIECFAQALDSLEPTLQQLRSRANAWALGDIEAIRELNAAPPVESCLNKLMNLTYADLDQETKDAVMQFQQPINDAARAANEQWLVNVEASLASNAVAFTFIHISELIRANGLLARLREKGYVVEEPAGGTATSVERDVLGTPAAGDD